MYNNIKRIIIKVTIYNFSLTSKKGRTFLLFKMLNVNIKCKKNPNISKMKCV